MLTASRIAAYVATETAPALSDETLSHITTVKADLGSLSEYEAQLYDKVQFLLDAALGLINMEQNDLFRLLIASIYGMNFHNMPELAWTFGYPIALFQSQPAPWFR